jgi:hypothetical protein
VACGIMRHAACACGMDVGCVAWTTVDLSPIDARASGLKSPSKALNFVLQGVVRMPKKPLSTGRDIKKVEVVVLPFLYFFSPASSFRFFFLSPPPEAHPLPPEYPRRPVMPCSTARDQRR